MSAREPGGGPRLAVCIVTHDDAADLPECLAAVAALATRPLEVVVVDCASGDDSVAVARAHGERFAAAGIGLDVAPLGENRGFAGGMNAALARTRAPWVLLLNPDARPAPDYAERLIARCEAAERGGLSAGGATGRLVRLDRGPDGRELLDACGMRLTLTWRHLDRASGEPERGQLARPERVFGATGAAALFVRRALADVALAPGEIFDPRFHTFREDAELAFRLHERGWSVLYEPEAHCLHRRFNLPERRAAMPAAANYHSLKNRYLLRAYHQTWGNLLWTLPFTLVRDLMAVIWVALFERGSAPAYRWLWRNRHEILARRRAVQARRTVPVRTIDRWFWKKSLPLD